MIIIGLLLLVVSVSLTAGVYARYVASATSANKQITAKTFYFTSNYLTENNHEYKLNAGTNSVTIDLYNYDCENPKLVSEVDCSYSVTVTPTKVDNEVPVSAHSYTASANTKTTINSQYPDWITAIHIRWKLRQKAVMRRLFPQPSQLPIPPTAFI